MIARRRIDQRSCPYCGDDQWMRLVLGRDHKGVLRFQLKCPACASTLVIPDDAVDNDAHLVHVVRPEAVRQHTYLFKGPPCWCQPRIVPAMATDGYSVVVHFDEEDVQ